MAKTPTSSDFAYEPCAIDIFVAANYIQLEVSCIVETLRIANRICGQNLFTYAYRSLEGGSVTSASDSTVQTKPCDRFPEADIAVFVGNADPNFGAQWTTELLNQYRGRDKQVVLLAEAAEAYIRASNNPDQILATHWESADRLLEVAPSVSVARTLATQSGNLVTCAGMVSSLDWALSMVEQKTSRMVMDRVRDVHLYGSHRDLRTMQLAGPARVRGYGNPTINKAIALMERNIEVPLSIREIADTVHCSSRALERQFNATVGEPPMSFYRKLRLLKAHGLLLNTDHPITYVADICGFGSGFAKQFRLQYGCTPAELRQRKFAEGG